jgi:hypothetical protein
MPHNEHARLTSEGKFGIAPFFPVAGCGSSGAGAAAEAAEGSASVGVKAALHVRTDSFVGLPVAALPESLSALVEGTDSVVQLVGAAEGAHVNSVVLSSKPTGAMGADQTKHW